MCSAKSFLEIITLIKESEVDKIKNVSENQLNSGFCVFCPRPLVLFRWQARQPTHHAVSFPPRPHYAFAFSNKGKAYTSKEDSNCVRVQESVKPYRQNQFN